MVDKGIVAVRSKKASTFVHQLLNQSFVKVRGNVRVIYSRNKESKISVNKWRKIL
jgi:hypothetical protein